MSRVINLSNSSECERNDPYFRVRTIIPERYIYEWIEQILVNELNIIPEKGRTYTLSFMDFPQLAEIFGVVGVTGDFDLTFTEEILILEVFLAVKTASGQNYSFSDVLSLNDAFFRYIQRYAGSICQIYVDRVVSDGGQVLDPLGVCAALGYFTAGQPSTNYVQSYLENVTLTDTFSIIGTARQYLITFFDFLNVVDTFLNEASYKDKLFFNDNVTVSDLFTTFKETKYKLNFQESIAVLTFESVVTDVNKKFTLAFIDSITPQEDFSDRRNKSFTLSFTENVGVASSN